MSVHWASWSTVIAGAASVTQPASQSSSSALECAIAGVDAVTTMTAATTAATINLKVGG